MITEAGGLVGNFTGEADYLYQREVRGRQPEDLRPAGADAGAVHRASRAAIQARMHPAALGGRDTRSRFGRDRSPGGRSRSPTRR